MTQAWSLRETDLFMWQRKLDRIDDARKDGNFFCPQGVPADLHAQRVSFIDGVDRTMLTFLDSALPDSKRLCSYLSTPHQLRTSVRGAASGVQPANDSSQMPAGSQEEWRRFQPQRALSIQYEAELCGQHAERW